MNDSDLDGNCSTGYEVSTPICSLCKAGYQFKNESCAKNSNATIENGCYDELDDKSCLLCISGWSMLEPNKCTDNNPPEPPKQFAVIHLINLFAFWMIYF